MNNFVLQVEHLTKYFGQVKVLNDVNISIKPGEICGIVGANGSGKSTFMNILFGNSVIAETGGYEGQIKLDGEPVHIRSTKDAVKKGIGMIHQEFVLIPEMTVTENIKLTREAVKPGMTKFLGRNLSFLDKKKDKVEAEAVLKELGFEIDSSYLVKDISVNAKQFVEIAREMSKENLKLLFLDEPTAVLNDEDAKKLLVILKKLSEQGTAILFCTHRLHEICEVCDSVVVIRDGNVISKYEREELSVEKLAKDMIGYEVAAVKKEHSDKIQNPVINFRNFAVDMPGEMLNGIDLDVFKGEILGLTSLSGHGKLALGYGVMGMYPASGEIIFHDKKLDFTDIRKTIREGIFLLPDDRKNMGLLLEHSIKDNIVFSGFYGKEMFRKKLFGNISVRDTHAMEVYAKEQIERLEIKCENMNQMTKELSGGNQQKVCIARAAAVNPEVLFIMEPTRGVDIGAKEKILDVLVEMNKKQGTTIVVASSELDELKRISDRIAVFCEGKLSAILPPDAPEERFALAYTGENPIEGEEADHEAV